MGRPPDSWALSAIIYKDLKHIIYLIFIAVVVSCTSTPEQNSTQVSQQTVVDPEPVTQEFNKEPTIQTSIILDSLTVDELAGTSYLLTTDFDILTCEALSRCDCCTSAIYFRTTNEYVYMFVCGGTVTFNKGNYDVSGSNITLNHDSLYVYEQAPFGDEEDEVKYGVFADYQQFEPSKIQIENCNGNSLLNLITGSPPERGYIDSTRSNLSSILANPDSEIAKKLNLNK